MLRDKVKIPREVLHLHQHFVLRYLMTLQKIGWLSTLLMLLACFDPHGEFINPYVYPPAPIDAKIEIANINEPFRLIFPTDFKFTVDRKEKELLSFEVLRDGKTWIVGSNENISFMLDPSDYADGSHEFWIKVKLSSGSGSVAEMLGAEYYLVEKIFKVTIDKSTPLPASGLSAQMVNGRLSLTWNKPDHEHFVYKLKRDYYPQELIEIKDVATTQYIDELFTGGKITYTLVLESKFFSVESESFTFELNPLEAEAILDEDGFIKIVWTTPFDFGDETFLKVSGRKSSQIFPLVAGEATVDTLLLGEDATASLTLSHSNHEDEGYRKDFTVSVGTRIKKFDYFALLPAQNKLIISKGYVYGFDDASTKIYRYDASTLTLEDSLVFLIPGWANYELLVSEDGAHAYIKYDNFFKSEPRLLKFDPLDFAKPTTTTSVSGVFGSYFSSSITESSRYSLSNENQILFLNYYYTQNLINIDMNTKAVRWYKNNIQDAIISSDGTFMIATEGGLGVVYKKTYDAWDSIGKIPMGLFFFTSDSSPRVIVSSNGVTNIYDPQSSTGPDGYFPVIRSGAINTTAYDRATNRIIQEERSNDHVSTLSVYDVNDFSLIVKTSANVSDQYIDNKHFYTGDHHLMTSGRIKKLK